MKHGMWTLSDARFRPTDKPRRPDLGQLLGYSLICCLSGQERLRYFRCTRVPTFECACMTVPVFQSAKTMVCTVPLSYS